MDYFISAGISAILMALKDKTAKRKFRNAFLKVRNAINLAFADDEGFQ